MSQDMLATTGETITDPREKQRSGIFNIYKKTWLELPEI